MLGSRDALWDSFFRLEHNIRPRATRTANPNSNFGLQEQVRIEIVETQAAAWFEDACLDEILEVLLRHPQDGARLLQLELYWLHVGFLNSI